MRRAALVVSGALVATGLGSAATAADVVTLNVRQYLTPNSVRAFVFSGQVSAGAPDEDVQVVGRDCLARGYRQLLGTRTVTGGYWQVENPSPDLPYTYVAINSGTTLRARWKNARSAPYLYRVAFPSVYALELSHRRWTVRVDPSPLDINLKGKTVVLQRRSHGAWVRYRSARLAHKPLLAPGGGAYNYQAVFAVPARALILRAYLPAASAAPCYLAGASKPWRS